MLRIIPSLWRTTIGFFVGMLLLALLFYSMEGLTLSAIPQDNRASLRVWVIDPSSTKPSSSFDISQLASQIEQGFRSKVSLSAVNWLDVPSSLMTASKNGLKPNIVVMPDWMIQPFASRALLSEVEIGRKQNERWQKPMLDRCKFLDKYYAFPAFASHLTLYINLSFAAETGFDAMLPSKAEKGISSDKLCDIVRLLGAKNACAGICNQISSSPYLLSLLLSSGSKDVDSILGACSSHVVSASSSKIDSKSVYIGLGDGLQSASKDFVGYPITVDDVPVVETFVLAVFNSSSDSADKTALMIANFLDSSYMGIPKSVACQSDSYACTYEKKTLGKPFIAKYRDVSSILLRFQSQTMQNKEAPKENME